MEMHLAGGDLWSAPVYDPVQTDAHGDPGKPYLFLIRDVQPLCGGVFLRWQDVPGADKYRVDIMRYGGMRAEPLYTGDTEATYAGLENQVDYEITVEAFSGDAYLGKSLARWVRPCAVPGSVVSYLHPDDYAYSHSGRSPATPGILRLPSGEMLASHDVYWGDAPQNMTRIFSSIDGGATWRHITDVVPCCWGKLFLHGDAVYMLGCAGECGDLLLGRSTDWGRTFSAPIVLYKGGTRRTGGPMRSSLPVVAHEGRLWTSMDVGSHPLGHHDTVIVSADAAGNLMDAQSWVCSEPLVYDPQWPGASKGATRMGFLEGNIIVGPDGSLFDILRYETRAGDPPYGLAAMLRIDTKHPEKAPSFERFLKFDGNLSRFTIVRHDSGVYFAAVSRVVDEPTYYRGRLSLMRSDDLITWEVARDLLDAKPICPDEWPHKTAFQYPDMYLEGDTLCLLSRTALFGAYNYHNANFITFHTFDVSEEVQRA